MMFPIPFVPPQGYRGGLGFGADRSNVAQQLGLPSLKHGAVDLLAPPRRTPVLAIDYGNVLKAGNFYNGTWAIEIRHSQFLARYGEVGPHPEVKVGDTVKPGQVIGYIGDQPNAQMLHLELFRNNLTGPLTLNTTDPRNGPYYLRRDFFDPTPLMDSLSQNAPYWAVMPKYDIYTDPYGGKFLRVA